MTSLNLSKYFLPLFLILGVSDIDFYIGYPIFDEQWFILILLSALGYAFKKFDIPLLIIGILLFLYYPYLTYS